MPVGPSTAGRPETKEEKTMTRFKKVLVYVNTDNEKHAALDRAVRLTETTGARLTAVDVVPDLPELFPELDSPPWVVPSEIATYKRDELLRLVAPFRRRGVEAEVDILYGNPAVELIREVQRNGHDLLLKTAERGGLTKLFGTTAMRLLRKCPCPVMLVKPGRAKRFARILAAVDIAPHDRENAAVSKKVLDLALSVAKFEGSELHVLHAWRVLGKAALRRAEVPDGELREYTESMRRIVQASFDEFLAGFDLPQKRGRVHLLEGDAGVVIPDFVKKRRVALLVMGSVARTGISGLLIGNTAERVVGNIGCSLLAVKPDDFVSPIQLEENGTVHVD